MAKRRTVWAFAPARQTKATVPASTRDLLKSKADDIIARELKPKYIQPPPIEPQFNYLIDIYSKWWRHYFYFWAKYACPGTNALAPSFDCKFARLEYIGTDQFNLSAIRHNDEWIELYPRQTLDECLRVIVEDPSFFPL